VKQAYIFNTGCIRRALDATRIHTYLKANGWTFTEDPGSADVAIVSTCGAVQDDEDLSLDALRHVIRNKAATTRVIVTGCLPKLNPQKIRELPGLDTVEFVPTGDLDKLDTALRCEYKLADVPEAGLVTHEQGLYDYVLGYRLFRHSTLQPLYKRLSVNRRFVRTALGLAEAANGVKRRLGLPARDKFIPYYNLRIGDGCLFACSFCCIRFATGRLKSRPIDRIVAELRRGLAHGHNTFQLVCEDTGCYGLDLGTTFPALLRELLKVEGDYQLLLIDVGGYWLVKYYDELLPLFLSHPEKIKELYVSLQSGSEKTLKAMNRPEIGREVRARLVELKQKMPHLTLRTTVIVGFPGEKEEDFQQTVQAVQEVDFSVVEINKYSDRPGTAASRMEGKLPPDVIDRRAAQLDRHWRQKEG
jgi:tRNA A37 methylthiotransferase MiaB